MQIKIFDVSHGFCAYLVADNGNVMLFDCGHNEQTGFRPSAYLAQNGCSGIEHFIIQNFDQDHVSDLPNILAKFPVNVFYRNRSISVDQLRALKLQSGTLTTQMTSALVIHRDWVHPVTNPPPFPEVEFKTFHNSYPTFMDTNNLSLVSFICYDGMGIFFTGDLETAGWLELLKNPSFCDCLTRTNILIASHHGRTTGYCAEVFDYCHPHIILISDKEVVHDTQEHDYTQHASGLLWNGGPAKRYVLTTRADGAITINKKKGEGYHVSIGA